MWSHYRRALKTQGELIIEGSTILKLKTTRELVKITGGSIIRELITEGSIIRKLITEGSIIREMITEGSII